MAAISTVPEPVGSQPDFEGKLRFFPKLSINVCKIARRRTFQRDQPGPGPARLRRQTPQGEGSKAALFGPGGEMPPSSAVVDRDGFEPPYGKPGQIYSLLPLTTRPPVHWRRYAADAAGEGGSMAKGSLPVKASPSKRRAIFHCIEEKARPHGQRTPPAT